MAGDSSQALQAIGAAPDYGDGITYKTVFGILHVWESDNWKDASMSWKEGCYVAANLTGPMETVFRGRDAQKFLSKLSINDVYKWPVGKSKHLVMCDEDGLVATHGLAVRDSEDSFRQMATLPWAAFQAQQMKMDLEVVFNSIFILQIAGPTSLQVLERAAGKSLRDVDFLDFREIEIGGVKTKVSLELARIGMTGNLAYEIHGPFEYGPAVYDAIYKAGQGLGIKRLGWRTYVVNHTEGGFPQLNCTFLGSARANENYMQSFPGMIYDTCTGSIDPADLRARFRTPQEVDWAWMAKFNHDFIGRKAVEAEAANPKRTVVTLRWNPEDAIDIFASLFQRGEEYKIIEMPCTPESPAGGHADLVTKGGKTVGVASVAVYSYYYREMISHCTIDIDQATIGNEVIVHWGDYGRRIKEVRATVERFPYLDLPRNKDYDLSTVPFGMPA